MRYIVQNILTGQYIDWDLPLIEAEVTFALSGPTIIRGRLGPEIPLPRMPVMEPWGNWIHVEEDGEVRASGIIQPGTLMGETIELDAIGPCGYPHGIPYLGEFSLGNPIGVNIDPLDVVRHIWSHLQSYPEGNLGVTLDSTTSPIRIGTPKEEVSFETGAGEQVEFVAGPYTIDWWELTDCGGEINKLSQETPFDYRDKASWNATKTDVIHHIELGYPRLGRKQDHLRFVQGENIIQAIPLNELPNNYASQIVVRGKGEGRDGVQGYAGRRIGTRVRRVAIINDKSIGSVTRANAIANDELTRRHVYFGIREIVVNAKHHNARMGTFGPGDDIFVQAEVSWLGDVAHWHRITSMSWSPDSDTVRITLHPSGTFTYGRLA
jgi:hypothetical protein